LAICSPKYATSRMDYEGLDGARIVLALTALQARVQRLQTARNDALAKRKALETRADRLDAALATARASAADRQRRAAGRAATARRDRALLATATVEKEIAVLAARVKAQHEAFARAAAGPRVKPKPVPAFRRRPTALRTWNLNGRSALEDRPVAKPHRQTPRREDRPAVPEAAPLPPPSNGEAYRECLARALANARDASETAALARVYARTVTT